MIASYNNGYEIVKILTDNGADINITDNVLCIIYYMFYIIILLLML